MPEFDQALFPSFAAGVPTLAPLSPLLNENDARAALTEPSSFYFLDSAVGTTDVMAHPAAVGDLNLPRNQFDIGSVRRDFPILNERVNGHPLIWLDNAATTQKPQSVIDRISYFYEHENSNIHRAAHDLAARATDAYEDARTKVTQFLNASSSKEIVFVRGATEAINLVAQAWGRRHINKGDEIVISWIEHHANIVPWQMLCAEKGACLRVAPVDDDGQILLDEYEKLLSPKTRLVSFTQVSNALGTVTRRIRWCKWPIGMEPGCCSMEPRPSPTCRSMCSLSIVISTFFLATRSSRLPGSACFTASRRCWRKLLRGKAAEI